MTRVFAFVGAAFVCLAASAPAAAGEFRIEGDDLASAKLVFDSKGIDRTSAETTARGLLEVFASIRSKTLEAKFESMMLKELKRMLQPLLTSESYNALLGKREERIRDGLQMMSKIKVKTDIRFTDTSVKDGVTTLRYVMAMQVTMPCEKCLRAEKADPACRCKGTGTRERKRSSDGAVLVKQKDKLWLVTAMKKKCYMCGGSGKAKNVAAPPTPPHKCAGPGCATCAPPAAGKVDCRECQGSGLRDDNFFRGPDRFEGLPTIDTTKPDQSSPEKAFASFAAALQGRRLIQKQLETKLGQGFQGFVKFFCHPDHRPTPRTRKADLTEYKTLEVHKDGEDTARINFATANPGAPATATKVAGKVELKKGGDGKWRISAVMTPCWSCGYQRKANPQFQCKRCSDTGFQKATYLP